MSITPLVVPPTSTPWVPVNGPVANLGGGFEFGYDQITAPVNVTATTEATAQTVIAGTPHTFDGNPVMFEFQAPYMQTPSVANSYVFAALFEGATEIARFSITATTAVSASYSTVRGSLRFTPSAGVHTYSVKAWASSTGAIIGAGAGGTDYGPAYLRMTSVAWYSGPGAGAVTPYGTTLPIAPYDGQEAVLVDSVTNPSYQWRFRYNAGSTSPYKWELVGGVPVQIDPGGGSTTSTTYVDLSGTPTNFALPRTGDYDIAWGCSYFYTSSAGNSAVLGAGATVGSLPNDTYALYTNDSVPQPGSRRRVLLGSSGTAKVQLHINGTGTATATNTWMTVIARRLA